MIDRPKWKHGVVDRCSECGKEAMLSFDVCAECWRVYAEDQALSSFIHAGSTIYLTPSERRCQCQKNSQESGKLTGRKKRSFEGSGRAILSKR